jgi:hypothetical protein
LDSIISEFNFWHFGELIGLLGGSENGYSTGELMFLYVIVLSVGKIINDCKGNADFLFCNLTIKSCWVWKNN